MGYYRTKIQTFILKSRLSRIFPAEDKKREQKGTKVQIRTQSPARLGLIIVSVIATTELAIMLVLDWWLGAETITPLYLIPLVDTVTLTIVVSIVIIYWVVKPIQKYYQELLQTSDALRTSDEKYGSLIKQMAEEQLRLQSSALNAAANAIIITDIEGMLQWCNPAFTELTGYTLEEAIGKNPRQLVKSGKHDQLFYKTMWETILSGQVWRGETINCRKNGTLCIVDQTITPVRNESGIVTNFIAIKQDITELKRAEEDLVKAKEKAEKLNKLKDAFIANISHEIRTPLNGVLGMMGLVEQSLSKHITKTEREYFNAIDQSSVRLIRTVDMILNFSRSQVGDFPIHPKKFSLSGLIENQCNEFRKSAFNKSLELIFENKNGNTEIYADEYCIIQAISNLIDNAVKYTDKGKITLILYGDTKTGYRLDIQDSGIGISEGFIEHIFEPYTQEHTGYNRAYEGIGLGLSLVKNYLELNGAEITFKSKKNTGTTFSILFKKEVDIHTEEPKPAIDRETDKIINSKVKNLKHQASILIVEDDSINQLYMRSLLKKHYNVYGVFTASKALEELITNMYDLVLMDISLKGDMNGLDLTKLLKKKKEFAHIPIIAVTGHTSPEDKQTCYNAGCEEFLAKPFSDKELLDKVSMFVDQIEYSMVPGAAF